MKDTLLTNRVFSSVGVAILATLCAVSFVFPHPARAEVMQSDINSQETVVRDKLVMTMTEYVKLLQLILIDKLEDRVHELRVARGLI